MLPKIVSHPDLAAIIAASAVFLSWWGFAAILVIGRKAAAETETKRDLRSHLGFGLQCCGYLLCFAFHRPYGSALMKNSRAGDWILCVFVVALAAGSDWFCLAAARQLGKQWALVARVVEGHELVQQGPYALVRNPIYTAMLVNLVATMLAFSTWWGDIVAAAVFLLGTEIRIRSEEKLLRENFGSIFEEYARHVPALFPRIP
jgi:protein-S-isoprenylcysteine O-methyltransferase Ste14